MATLMFIIFLVIVAAVVMVVSIQPHRSVVSTYELERRRKHATDRHELDDQREAAYANIISAQRVIQAVLLILMVVISIGAFGWLAGTFISIVVALFYGSVARQTLVHSQSQRLYNHYEKALLPFVLKHSSIFGWVRTVVPERNEPVIESKEELEYLLDTSPAVSHAEKDLLVHVLDFEPKLVGEVMTPRSVVATIKKGEILGPLVLDDLHKTGFSRIPVIDEDIDHVIGILYLHDLLTLNTARRHTSQAETAMEKRVFYIREDQPLQQALAGFLKTHHHLFIVVNEFRETVGILTLEDTIEALLGTRIVDEFDAHEDLRAVAARNPHANNTADTAKDI
jgi:putative hemolysin